MQNVDADTSNEQLRLPSLPTRSINILRQKLISHVCIFHISENKYVRSFEIVSLSDTLARKPRSGARYQAILPVRAPHTLLFCCFRVILGNPWDYFGVKCSKHASHVLSSGVHLLLSSTETQNFGPAAATRNRGDCIRLVVLIHFIQLNFSVTK